MEIVAVLKKNKLVTGLSLVLVTAIIVFVLWAFVALHISYADGTRGGYLQKISKRGWLCKTWEGDLQLSSIPGSAPTIFQFTTRSDSLAAEITKLTGKQVVLEYKQRKGVPSKCFGDTEYFVTGVRTVLGP
jgi:hypothetical protein